MAEPNELKDFQEFYSQLEKQNNKTQEYEGFLTAMKAVSDKMTALYTKDKYGRIPLVKQEDKDELLALHKTLGERAEVFLKQPGNLSKQAVSTVKKLSALNHVFYTATNEYDPSRGKALHTIHEEARTPVIDTRNQELKAQVGGAMSKRQPLTFLDPSGKEVFGVFIPEKYENGAKNIMDAFTKGAPSIWAKTPKGKQVLRAIADRFKEWNTKAPNDPIETARFAKMLSVKGTDPPKFTSESICKFIKKQNLLDSGSIQREIGAISLQALAETLNTNYQSMVMNHSAGIEAGSRIDTRNAAMSSLAELLDVPGIIARARPMQVIDENGKTVNGTFMLAAEGVDPENIPKEYANINMDAAKGTDGNAFREIADMQVLDYIAGNVDRHGSNFFMKFDKKGKLIGVQGIDNDCSGGCIVPKYKRGINSMTGIRDMKVMSQSMYNKLKSMTDEQLKFALRGYGHSEQELEAHVARMKQVLTAADDGIEYYRKNPNAPLKQGVVKVVPDDQFKKLKLEDLATYSDQKVNGRTVKWPMNAYAHVQSNLHYMRELYQEQEDKRRKQKKAFETLKSNIAIGETNRANPGAIRRQGKKADTLYSEMGKRTNFWKFFWKSSANYEDMEKAMKDYTDYKNKLLERLKLAQDPVYTGKKKNSERNFDREAIVSREDLEKLQQLGQKVFDTSDKYVTGKAGKAVNDMKEYERNRLEIGQMARSFGEQAKKPITLEELQTVTRNEKLAQESDERIAGNKKEAEDLKKGGPVA